VQIAPAVVSVNSVAVMLAFATEFQPDSSMRFRPGMRHQSGKLTIESERYPSAPAVLLRFNTSKFYRKKNCL